MFIIHCSLTADLVNLFIGTEDPIPDLQSFNRNCAEQILRQALFQNEPLHDVNMLKLPVIMAPKLLGKQVNNDENKKTVFSDQTGQYSDETLAELTNMINSNKIDVLHLENLHVDELKSISVRLGFIRSKNSKTKSEVALRNELKLIVKEKIARISFGTGVCHKYIQVQGRTGGWQDSWCQHGVKLGAKMEAMQGGVHSALCF